MSIEISTPAATSQPNTRTTARGAQAQPVAGDAPAVSFLSLLGTMGLAAADLAPVAIAGQGLPGDGRPGAEPGAEVDDPAVLLVQPQPQAQLPVNAWPQVAATVMSRAGGAAGQPGTDAGPASVAGSARRTDAAQAVAADAALLPGPGGAPNATAELQQLPAQALAQSFDESGASASPRDFMARMEAARTAADAESAMPQRAASTTAAAQPAGQVASMFDTVVAGWRSGGVMRSQERAAPRVAGSGPGQGFVPWGDAMPAGTTHGASAVYAPGAMTPAPATAMAEKVHYWVSRGVQSAELQLEAFAGGSVEVSIAVKGDEAIVEFRTDQPQARQLLLDAMPQLKELLAGEGLMLSGGFVGGSAQQGGQSQGRGDPAPMAREALVKAPAQAATGRTAPAPGAPGARLDLFV